MLLKPDKLNYVTIQCTGGAAAAAPPASPRASLIGQHCPDCANAMEDDTGSTAESITSTKPITSRCSWHQRHHNLRRNMLRLVLLIVVVLLCSVLLVTALTVLASGYFGYFVPRSVNGNSVGLEPTTSVQLGTGGAEARMSSKLTRAQKAEISRKTWEMLNRNSAKDGEQEEVLELQDVEEPENNVDRIPVPEDVFEPIKRPVPGSRTKGVVLPSVMVYTPSSTSTGRGGDEGHVVKDYLAYR